MEQTKATLEAELAKLRREAGMLEDVFKIVYGFRVDAGHAQHLLDLVKYVDELGLEKHALIEKRDAELRAANVSLGLPEIPFEASLERTPGTFEQITGTGS
jgi:hypothetical protein